MIKVELNKPLKKDKYPYLAKYTDPKWSILYSTFLLVKMMMKEQLKVL